jgi:hypothetical protein
MKQSKMLFALAGFVLTPALALPALANECPAGWTLTTVDKAANSQEARKFDGNKDQYVCEKSTSGTVTYKDNHQHKDKDKDKPKPK